MQVEIQYFDAIYIVHVLFSVQSIKKVLKNPVQFEMPRLLLFQALFSHKQTYTNNPHGSIPI